MLTLASPFMTGTRRSRWVRPCRTWLIWRVPWPVSPSVCSCSRISSRSFTSSSSGGLRSASTPPAPSSPSSSTSSIRTTSLFSTLNDDETTTKTTTTNTATTNTAESTWQMIATGQARLVPTQTKPEKTRKNPKKPEKTRQISPSSPTPAARRFPKRPLDGGSAAQSRSPWLDGGSAAQSRSPSLDGGTAARWGFLSANDGALFLSWPLDGAAQAFPIPTRHRWEPVLKPFSLSYSFSFELKNGICTFSSSLCKIGGMFSFFLSGFVLFDLIC